MGKEEVRQAIIDYASKGAKTKFYFKDMLEGVKKTIPTTGATASVFGWWSPPSDSDLWSLWTLGLWNSVSLVCSRTSA